MKLAHAASTQVVLPVSGLRDPYTPAANAAGDVVVTDTGNDRVLQRLHGSGTWTVLPFTGLTGPKGAAIDASGDVFTADGNRVLELPAGSSTQKVLPFSDISPQCVAVDADGDVFVTDWKHERVVELPHGSSAQTVVPFTGLYGPQGLAVDIYGNVFVADWGHQRVLVLPAGSSTQSVLHPFDNALGNAIAVDAYDNVFVADNNSGTVQELPYGAGSTRTIPVGVVRPAGMALDGAGDVFVLDWYWWTLVELPNLAGPPPDTTIDSGPTGTVRSTQATFTFSSNQASSTFACSLDGAGYVGCSSPKVYSELDQGHHTFSVVAINAGAEADPTPAVASWAVDTLAPQTKISAGPSGTVASTRATLRFTASESDATFLCARDGATSTTCSSPLTYTGLTQGKHVFTVKARDAVGNIDPTPAVRSWTVDTVAPRTTITGGPTGRVAAHRATFRFTSSQRGSTFSCSLDGAAFRRCTSPRTYDALKRGRHVFEVKARDIAGNVDASPAVRRWTVK